ncbi:hypothetical protein ACQ143_12265 [Microbacterium sp. MC2]
MRPHDPGRLTLEPLDDTSWRLCDGSAAPSDAANVLAYVELRDDGRYDVTWVVRGLGTAVFATFGDLLREAAVLLDCERSRVAKPHPIPHRPPLRAS